MRREWKVQKLNTRRGLSRREGGDWSAQNLKSFRLCWTLKGIQKKQGKMGTGDRQTAGKE